jgi:hypothetical protein
MPGISQISRYDMDRWGDYWRFTNASVKRVFEKHFSPEDLEINIFGNVLAATAFLQGIAVEDLDSEQLSVVDPDYQVILGIRAVKGSLADEDPGNKGSQAIRKEVEGALLGPCHDPGVP